MGSPCGPSAVPTGGAGVAAPPAMFILIIVLIFLAIVFVLKFECRKEVTEFRFTAYLLVQTVRQLADLPGLIKFLDYNLLTCKKSSSTGVSRPKIETRTFSLPLASSVLSIVPKKSEKGPSTIFTASPIVK